MAIDFNIDQALAKLGELVTKHGAQAIDVAAQVERVSAINTLSGTVGWGVMVVASAWAARWCFRRFQKVSEVDGFDAGPWLFPAVLAGAGSLGALLGAMTCLLDVWAWVALFNPKLALAHHILAKYAGL